MSINSFRRLPERTQGIIFLTFGCAMIILYIFGILQKSLAMAVVALAIITLFLGFKKLEVFSRLGRMFHRRK